MDHKLTSCLDNNLLFVQGLLNIKVKKNFHKATGNYQKLPVTCTLKASHMNLKDGTHKKVLAVIFCKTKITKIRHAWTHFATFI